MVIFFSEADLVSFGEYILSEERSKMILNHPDIEDRSVEALKQVYDADIANWVHNNANPQ